MQDIDLMEVSKLVNEKLYTDERFEKAMEKAEDSITNGCKKLEEDVSEGYKKVEKGVTGGYKKIEDSVVSGYKKIEEGAVSGFNRVSDKFVEKLFTREGETVEEAKKRLADGAKQPGRNKEEEANEEK